MAKRRLISRDSELRAIFGGAVGRHLVKGHFTRWGANKLILITLPIFLPVLAGLGIDPVHFAIIMVINMELAVITPPIGMNLFVISSISGVPIARVFRGTLPFIGLIAAMLLFCTYSEEASLWSLRLLG